MRVLDLGYGKATSSIFLAREFGIEAWAADGATSPTENRKRAIEMDCDASVFPLRVDAHSLPFAKEFFDAVIASVCERGFSRSGPIIHRAGHRAELPEPLRAAGETLRQALAAQPLEPPSRKQLAPDAASQRALRFLIDTGEVVEISTELVMSARSVAQASAQVRAFIGQHGPATVSELRQSVGASRRIVVPLLEYLDRTFVTLRHGDKRTLR